MLPFAFAFEAVFLFWLSLPLCMCVCGKKEEGVPDFEHVCVGVGKQSDCVF